MTILESLASFNFQAFVSIVFIDLVMSGDNAIIIGMAAAGLAPEQRRKAICLGIVAATVLRIGFSVVTYQLLSIIGLTLAGGILLLWVAYRMWREFQTEAAADCVDAATGRAVSCKTMQGAMLSIIVADVSMSLDNVLAVAGAAHGAPGMLVFGLVLSIALMAFAANFVAMVLERYKWLAYVGLIVVAYVALDMIWRGSFEVVDAVSAAL